MRLKVTCLSYTLPEATLDNEEARRRLAKFRFDLNSLRNLLVPFSPSTTPSVSSGLLLLSQAISTSLNSQPRPPFEHVSPLSTGTETVLRF